MASSTFFIPSVNVIGADSLTDAMNMMADYGFTRTLIVTDSMLTKLGMALRDPLIISPKRNHV